MRRRIWRKKSKPAAVRALEHHKDLADRIIKQIKEGVAPWQKPWKPGEKFLPENFKSGKTYRGTNTVNLASVAIERGYSDNRWGTYRQIRAAGGQVRAGEKGARILYYSTHRKKAVKDDRSRPVKDKDGRQVYEKVPRARPFPKHYTVFNAEQADRLNLPERPDPPPSWAAHDAAERVIRASKVDFRHQRGDRAEYNLTNDRVTMPPRSQFGDPGAYYRTALHEVAHASGHPKRMDRQGLQDAAKTGSGSEAYAREELRAEISSMMTNTALDIGHQSRHGAAYVKSWVKALEDNPAEIAKASHEAQGMSAYMLEQPRKREQRDQDQAKSATTVSKGREIQYEKTGPNRFEYRQGERTAVVDKIPGSHDSHSVTMGDRSNPARSSVKCESPHEAVVAARSYVSTGKTPTPTPTADKTADRQVERDDGPSR